MLVNTECKCSNLTWNDGIAILSYRMDHERSSQKIGEREVMQYSTISLSHEPQHNTRAMGLLQRRWTYTSRRQPAPRPEPSVPWSTRDHAVETKPTPSDRERCTRRNSVETAQNGDGLTRLCCRRRTRRSTCCATCEIMRWSGS